MTGPILIVVKAVFSAAMVVAVTLTAERLSTRLAGVLIGFPLGAGLTLFFLGVEQGPSFAAGSALWSIPGILATLAFCWCYRQGIGIRCPHIGLSLLLCCLTGLAGYFAAAEALRLFMPAETVARVGIVVVLVGVLAVIFRRVSPRAVGKRLRFSWPLLALRASFATLVILTVTGLASVVGPTWSGLLAAFPTTILPSTMILHFHYGGEIVPSLFRDTPPAILSIVIFSLAVHWSFPALGVLGGTVFSYAAAFAYLAVYELWLRRLFDRALAFLSRT